MTWTEHDRAPCDPLDDLEAQRESLTIYVVMIILGIGALLLGLLAACAAPHRPPVVPPPIVTQDQLAHEATCRAVISDHGAEITPEQMTDCLARTATGSTLDELRAWSDTFFAPMVHADGIIWRAANGAAWRWKGVSAFGLMHRFVAGAHIEDFLAAYPGYNVLRVWPYVPEKDWGTQAWDVPSVAQIKGFLAYVYARGWSVELTLLTDDDPARLAWAQRLVPQLAGTRGLFVEIGNEPDTHKHIETATLIPALTASGLHWTTGNYEDSHKMTGTYGVTHTPRDAEWPRRTHDAYEFAHGGGPNTPTDPAHRMPIVLDEPPKLEDVGGNRLLDWRAYFGSCALFAAGCTFHSGPGKYGRVPTAAEQQLAAEALAAMDAFPAEAPLGAYRRIDEHGQALRTYVIGGRYMVRIRPTTTTAPEPGWTPIDGDGILWRR